MARLESEGKGGFYPTPPVEMEYIIKRLKVEEDSEVNLIDPCCGKGLALKQWKDNIKSKGAAPTSYGIEIEKSRANEAESNVDNIAKGAYEEVRMSHNAFSAMYLNPPFMRMNGERMELTFLRDLTTNYLQTGGIFVFNIPQIVLKDIARLLANRFDDIKVYRFSDENFDAYKQVIVYGIRSKKGIRTEKQRQKQYKVEHDLSRFSFASKDELPTLDTPDWDSVYYTIPRHEREVATFQSMRVEAEDVIRSLEAPSNDFFNKVYERVNDINIAQRDGINPAMPLKTAHMATAIASGTLPEDMGDHLLVGISKQVHDEEIKINPKSGKEEEVITIRSESIVRVFSEDGIFNLQ